MKLNFDDFALLKIEFVKALRNRKIQIVSEEQVDNWLKSRILYMKSLRHKSVLRTTIHKSWTRCFDHYYNEEVNR